MSRIANIIGQFSTKKVLVLGAVMLDKYIWGIVERISPEAPVQIVSVTKESYAPGGAANVASNIASLGGQVSLIGLISQVILLFINPQTQSSVTYWLTFPGVPILIGVLIGIFIEKAIVK